MGKINKLLLTAIFAILCSACENEYTPKPKGYLRIDLPEKSFSTYKSECPFTFDYNKNAKIVKASNENPCWLNIDYPSLKCRIHLSYKKVDDNLPQLLEDSRTLVYKHTIKASAINQKNIINMDRMVYAKIYEIEGDAASSVQFYATDSFNHFLRGALYFNAASNADSLKPAIDFVRQDIEHLVNSIQWVE